MFIQGEATPRCKRRPRCSRTSTTSSSVAARSAARRSTPRLRMLGRRRAATVRSARRARRRTERRLAPRARPTRPPISARSTARPGLRAWGPPAPARPTSPSRWPSLLRQQRGRADHPVAASGRGGRAPGLLARRPQGEGRPLPAAALRRAAGHAAGGQAAAADRDRPDRDRAARLHARPDAGATPTSSSTRRRTPRPSQMKMFLTRMGENSRMVVTGDPTQTDLPPGMPSGWSDAVAKLEGRLGIAVVRFDKKDVVRHPLVSEIIQAYETAARLGRQPMRSARSRSDGAAFGTWTATVAILSRWRWRPRPGVPPSPIPSSMPARGRPPSWQRKRRAVVEVSVLLADDSRWHASTAISRQGPADQRPVLSRRCPGQAGIERTTAPRRHRRGAGDHLA